MAARAAEATLSEAAAAGAVKLAVASVAVALGGDVGLRPVRAKLAGLSEAVAADA
jgi:hypothetical protein